MLTFMMQHCRPEGAPPPAPAPTACPSRRRSPRPSAGPSSPVSLSARVAGISVTATSALPLLLGPCRRTK